jgi:hypothetical protein
MSEEKNISYQYSVEQEVSVNFLMDFDLNGEKVGKLPHVTEATPPRSPRPLKKPSPPLPCCAVCSRSPYFLLRLHQSLSLRPPRRSLPRPTTAASTSPSAR